MDAKEIIDEVFSSKKEDRFYMFPKSFRDYTPGQFERYYRECEGNWRCEREVRGAYRGFESGRWAVAMDKMHRFLVHLDGDELERFIKEYPSIIVLVNEYALIEELRVLK